jgi:DNA-binding winged helix-turn-helix (wHTH) protein/tetratricopeptide (TPR) repeat protein
MPVVTFGPYRLDLITGELQRAGVALKLQPQPAKLLVLLVEHAGQLVTRDEIRRAVWGNDTFVDFDQSVNFCIRQIRAALHDQADTPCYVETIPRRGYRFVAPVQTAADRSAADASVDHVSPTRPAAMSHRLAWGGLVVLLTTSAIVFGVLRNSGGVPDPPGRAQAQQEVELGRYFLNKFTAPDTLAAIEHFEASAKADPHNARAFAGLAEAYNQSGTVFIAGRRPPNARLLAVRAAVQAIQLDPNLADAYAALGYTTMHEFDWEQAAGALRRALALDPRNVPAHLTYAGFLAARRRFGEAIAEARRAVDLAPASVRARQVLAWMLYFDRRYDSAERELRTILQMDASYALAHFQLGQLRIVTHRWEEAIPPLETAVEIMHRAPASVGLLAMAYAGGGRRSDAERLVDELERRAAHENVPPGALLLGYLAVNDKARAIDMLQRGYDERDNYEVNIAADPLMDPLRDEPRFRSLCQQVLRGTRLDTSHTLNSNEH